MGLADVISKPVWLTGVSSIRHGLLSLCVVLLVVALGQDGGLGVYEFSEPEHGRQGQSCLECRFRRVR